MICPRCHVQYAADAEVCAADATRLVAAEDPVEATFVDTLRTEPSDQPTRQVYADWLEQHGYQTRAAFLRLDADEDLERDESGLHALALPTDAAWRAITSRAPIAKCVSFEFVCPKRWDALTPTRTDGVRHCGACNKPVYFCSTVDEARAHGANGECVAVDAALTRTEAEAAYDFAGRRGVVPPLMGKPAMHDPPIMMGAPVRPPPPPTGLLTRIKGWFGK